MLTLFSHKASLLYVGGCFVVATIAVAKLADGQGSDQVLAGDRAHAVMPELVASAKLLEAQIEWPVTPRAKKPTLVQTAASAFAQAEAARSQDQHSQALGHYQTALELAQKAEHRAFEALLWHQIGKTYQAAQDERQATIAYQNAVALGRETDNHVVLGEAQADLARLYEHQGNLKAALPLYRQALVSLQKVGDQQTAQALQSQTHKLETMIAQAAKARSSKAIAQTANASPKSPKPSSTVATVPPKAAPSKNRVQPQTAQPVALKPPVQAVSHAPERLVEPEFARPDPEPPLPVRMTAPLDPAVPPLDAGTT